VAKDKAQSNDSANYNGSLGKAMDTEKVLEMAEELVRAIAGSAAALRYEKTMAAVGKDAELAEQLRQYNNLLRGSLLPSQGNKPPTFDDERSLSLKYSSLCQNPEAKAAIDAQGDLVALLASVQGVLSGLDINIGVID